MKKNQHLFLQICSIVLLVAILTVVIVNNRLIVGNQDEVDTSISSIVESTSTTKENIITSNNVVSSTKNINKTITNPKNILTASDVMALPGISELVASMSNEDKIKGRFMYCCTNNTYYLLSNDKIVDSFTTKSENDFINYFDFLKKIASKELDTKDLNVIDEDDHKWYFNE